MHSNVLTYSLVAAALAIALIAAWWSGRRFLRKLLRHQRADWGRLWLNYLDGLNRILCTRFHRLEHEPLPLPASGGAIVVANHVSGLDPLLMIAASPRPLRFIIAREEYDRWYLRWLFRAVGCIPIGRRGGHRQAMAKAIAAVRAGEVVALFPHGGIRLESGPLPLKPGVAFIARETKAPIFVLRLDGVRRKGHTVSAVFWRSRARIRVRGCVDLSCADTATLLEELGRRLA